MTLRSRDIFSVVPRNGDGAGVVVDAAGRIQAYVRASRGEKAPLLAVDTTNGSLHAASTAIDAAGHPIRAERDGLADVAGDAERPGGYGTFDHPGPERHRSARAAAGAVHGVAGRAPWGVPLPLPRAGAWLQASTDEVARFAAGARS